MKVRNIIIIVLIFGLSINCWSQEFIEQLKVPSPNVAAFNKYIDTPVSLYTGIPSISIPIYNIQAKDFSLPIQLGYHAGGIKVSEEASWVGLGWNLNAGGVISRTVRGKDDLAGGYPFYENQYVFPDHNNDIIIGVNDNNIVSELQDMKNNIVDSEPDIFYFNFAGFSGKFFFEKCTPIPCQGNTLKGISQKGDNLDIIYNWSTKDWVITDVYGNRYFFGTEEITNSRSISASYETPSHILPANDAGYSVTSWFIDQIITNKGEVISFEYDTCPDCISQSQPSRSEHVAKLIETSPPSCQNGTISSSGLNSEYRSWSSFVSITNDVYLERIVFPNGYLEFKKSPRLDIKKYIIGEVDDPQKLDKIKLYQNNNSTAIKEWELHQSYFGNPSTNQEPTEFYRLKLDSLSVKSSNNLSVMPPYSFKYLDSNDVPSKLTKDFDHWGYFNGANNDSKPLWGRPPGGTSQNYGTSIPTGTIGGVTYRGADRNANTDKAKIFTLYEINFPTGGKHTYEFESNEYFNSNPVIEEIVERSKSLFPSITTCESQQQGSVGCNTNASLKTIEFEVTQDMVNKSPTHEEGYIIANFNFYVDGSINGCENNYDLPTETTPLANLRPISGPNGNYTGLYKLNINYPNRMDLPNGCTPFTEYYEYDSDFDSRYPHINSVVLTPGWYKLTINSARNYLETYAEATYKEEELIGTLVGNQLGGGLRVKKITLDSGNNSPNIIKTYEYMKDDNVTSSGLLMSPYVYLKESVYQTTRVVQGNESVSVVCNFNSLFVEGSSNSISPLSNAAQGNFIGYSNVKEYNSENSMDNGYSEYRYYNSPDILDAERLYMPGLPTTPYLDNGLLKDVFVYDSNNKKKQWVKNVYERHGQENIMKGLKLSTIVFQEPFDGITEIQANLAHFYDINYQWYKMTSKETIDYDENENPLVTRKQNFKYYYHNKLPRDVSEIINEGGIPKTTETSYEYAQDFNASEFGSNILRDKKMYGQVLREKTAVDAVDVSRRESYYGLINNHGLLNEVKVYPANSGNPISTDISYDSDSNIAKIEREDGTPSSALWGYENQYLVAKVENATRAEIESTLTATELSEITAGYYDEDTMRSTLNKIRDGLPNAMVTTYTYDPLVGVTSITDPRGYTTYYEYDEFNRLKHVKEAEGNILSENEYNYKQ